MNPILTDPGLCPPARSRKRPCSGASGRCPSGAPEHSGPGCPRRSNSYANRPQ
nr:MAG TPA: hypothetical protein [Caudoviricetes sp.]